MLQYTVVSHFNTKIKVNVSVAEDDRIYNSVTDVGFISSQYLK